VQGNNAANNESEDIMKTTIDMAREAGAIHIHERPKEFALVGNESIKAFESLVRADEREACAKVADKISDKYGWGYSGNEVDTADEIAAAIRARGQA
jgi:hypothetical protein